jgi:PIN domain nuclease of toxin-antitoxin system
MIAAVADTHAVIWYLYGDNRLTAKARSVFDDAAQRGDQVTISSITLAEIVYLGEKGRISPATLTLTLAELNSVTGLLTETPVDRQIVVAMSRIERTGIPDLPDRIIGATALHLAVPLISRDGKIRSSGLTTIW